MAGEGRVWNQAPGCGDNDQHELSQPDDEQTSCQRGACREKRPTRKATCRSRRRGKIGLSPSLQVYPPRRTREEPRAEACPRSWRSLLSWHAFQAVRARIRSNSSEAVAISGATKTSFPVSDPCSSTVRAAVVTNADRTERTTITEDSVCHERHPGVRQAASATFHAAPEE